MEKSHFLVLVLKYPLITRFFSGVFSVKNVVSIKLTNNVHRLRIFDSIRIDSFVIEIGQKWNKSTYAERIKQMEQSLNFQVPAEGLEQA